MNPARTFPFLTNTAAQPQGSRASLLVPGGYFELKVNERDNLDYLKWDCMGYLLKVSVLPAVDAGGHTLR